MSAVHDGHRRRLKQQFAEHGGEGMNDIQFLEMLLFYAIPRSDTNELAHALLERYGTIRGVLDASEADLLTVDGAGESTALLIRTLRETLRRYMSSQTPEKAYICSSADAGKYFVPILQYETEEKVCLRNALHRQREHSQARGRGRAPPLRQRRAGAQPSGGLRHPLGRGQDIHRGAHARAAAYGDTADGSHCRGGRRLCIFCTIRLASEMRRGT